MRGRRFRYNEEAEAELEAAAQWYGGRRAGLGSDLVRISMP